MKQQNTLEDNLKAPETGIENIEKYHRVNHESNRNFENKC